MMPNDSLSVKSGCSSIFPNKGLRSVDMADDTPKNPVRKALGENIARIRKLRGMTVRDLSAKLDEHGLRLSPSGVSEVENASRKVPVEELLIFAIALNTSLIDLIIPDDRVELVVAKGLSLTTGQLESWLRGDSPWRQLPYGTPMDAEVSEEFWAAAAKRRQADRTLLSSRPEIAAIERLKSHVRLVAQAQSDPNGFGKVTPFTAEAEVGVLRQLISDLDDYIALLVSSLERDGYAG